MNVLKKICKSKIEEVEILKDLKDYKRAEKNIQTRGFFNNLKKEDNLKYKVITEIKKKSPSKGLICKNFNLIQIAKDYERAGASCVSILTEKKYFGGDISFLKIVKNSINLPILRKDFIIDEWQVYESYFNGADCILLILAILDDSKVKDFYQLSNELGMDVISEVHDYEELERALKLNLNCIGINNRNLKTLDVNLKNFKALVKEIPKDILKICESGIKMNSQLRELTSQGADAFLIGESLMISKDICNTTKNLIKK